MEIRSIYKGARISAFKAREVTREIQGLAASAALDVLGFSPKKAATLIKKTLKSAIANAENNANLRITTLVVKEATVGEGPTFRRFRARARGSASPILKRTSHIRIILTDEVELPESKSTKRNSSNNSKVKATAKSDVKVAADSQKQNSKSKVKSTEHVHGPGCNHDHDHDHEDATVAKSHKKSKVPSSSQQNSETQAVAPKPKSKKKDTDSTETANS